MLVKLLDENRVKILMEECDIDHYGLPFEKLNYEDPQSRAFIYELIQRAHDQTGVNFQDSRVMIEVIPGVSRAYYILLTKMIESGRGKIEFDKSERSESETYLFRLSDGEHLLHFLEQLQKNRPDRSDVYRYHGNYYVTATYLPYRTAQKDFARFILRLGEYAGRCRYHYANEGILHEWGEHLIGPDACVINT